MADIAKKSYSRVFTIENRAGPTHVPMYHSFARAGTPERSFGDVTRIEYPSPYRRGDFEVAGETTGQTENPTISLQFLYTLDRSEILALANKLCPFDVQIHIGKCSDPRNFDTGWSSGKVLVIERSRVTNWSATDLGALGSDEEDKVNEDVDITGLEMYEILPMVYAEKAATEVGQEIVDIVVCDTPECGDCGDPTDGGQKVFAISAPAGTSPGVLPEVIYTEDGFTTQSQIAINTLAVTENPNAAACVGDYLVVISEDSESLHYEATADILNGIGSFTEVTTGFVATKGPLAIAADSATAVWIAAEGGYIYFSSDITAGVSVQSAGAATAQDLNAIDAYDGENVVAVGNANAVIYTVDAGNSWAAVTGPDTVGTPNLSAIAMRSDREWWVGTATGKLYYTTDRGAHWAEKTFPGSGSGAVKDIVWLSNSVGFLSHQTAATAGRILRSINGGYSWKVEPISVGSIPANDKLNALIGYSGEVNVIYAAGLADNGADGIIIKGKYI